VLGPFTPAEWTAFDGSFEAPVGTDFLTIQFVAVTGAAEGSVSSMHVDNASLTQEQATPAESKTWGGVKTLHR
jgi:hypothetical protein